MAVTATLQTLHDGPKNLVVKAHFVGDGTDASSVELLDISDYSGYVAAGAFVKIEKIWFSGATFDIELEWDASSNVDILTLSGEGGYELDFRDIGGLINNAGSGITGDIDFTTTGNANTEDATVILYMKKRTV